MVASLFPHEIFSISGDKSVLNLFLADFLAKFLFSIFIYTVLFPLFFYQKIPLKLNIL